ncbi:1,4-dihydroxy-2-naphthoate polyprenyltransferase [Peribacillus kribbensis]|uniref:1,4-dihydroxy-2-naphthoate polyprenyltransferase n=1 Tax=Peribacillus kribbensis TaxID=356658 RepID=UPI0004245D35|nr:1,4-dihydroxy-2-naphthoate polyprenyltransferase [Peribacillus kribbensis]
MHTHLNTQPKPLVKDKNNWRVWWQLTRPHTLTAGFVPVLVGTALALNEKAHFHAAVFICMMVATLFIQMATNMFNEYYDYKRGLDNENSIGIGGAIVREGVSPQTVLTIALTLYGLSILLGIYICSHSSWWLALIGLICMSVGYLYTGGPFPIAYTPFGEIFAGLFMGVFVILIAFFIQAGYVSANSVLVSIPVALLVGAINLANNIRDLEGDKENGRKTLAILAGRKNAIIILGSSMAVSYIWIISLILSDNASPWLLLVLLSIPKAVKATKGFVGKTQPLQMMPAMKATAQTNTIFGFLLSIGLFINYFI